MDRRLDPRSIVTPYAFAVHPDLLGKPLATPAQRLGAITVDLVVIGFISQIGMAPLAIVSTALLFWLAFRKSSREAFGKKFRVAVGCLGFLILSASVLVILWIRFADEVERLVEETPSDPPAETAGSPGSGGEGEEAAGEVGLLDLYQGFRGATALRGAQSREEAQTLMNDFVQGASAGGLPRSQIRDLLGDILPADAPWITDAPNMVDAAMARLDGPSPAAGEDPGPEGETEVPEISVELSPTAADSIARLNRAILSAQEDQADADAALRRAQNALEAGQDQGVLGWLWGLIDELGIGFGWAALYLTIVHAWWKGTSIGKRLFRIRVVMIDKRPLNWWLSFERAGGYAAGFATGLLGFAQIFWDPNRQAIHDKVSETIVIQEGKAAIPGPWIEEGKAQWARGRDRTRETPET